MRTIDFDHSLRSALSGGQLEPPRQHLLSSVIRAYLTWPEDAEAREDFISTSRARIAQLEAGPAFEMLQLAADKMVEQETCIDEARITIEQLLQELPLLKDVREGGREVNALGFVQDMVRSIEIRNKGILQRLRSVHAAPTPTDHLRQSLAFASVADPVLREDMLKQTRAWTLAGMRLRILGQMATWHATELKSTGRTTASLIIAGTAGTNKDRIDDSWKSHRSVAHLAAAVVDVAQRECEQAIEEAIVKPPELSETINRYPGEILSTAMAFESFGLTSKVGRAEDTHLDPATTWRVGLGPPAQELSDFLGRLSPRQLRAASG